MIDWILFLQILLLLLIAYLLVASMFTHVIDKRREDDFKRRDGGL